MTNKKPAKQTPKQSKQRQSPDSDAASGAGEAGGRPREIGGPRGRDPTRYGDWEKNGRCIDF